MRREGVGSREGGRREGGRREGERREGGRGGKRGRLPPLDILCPPWKS